MKQYSAEIVAVGTELLLGQIANTNAQWLSSELALCGVNVFNHSVVGDNLDRVKEVFLNAHGRSDIIIVTGGLGPTEDDLTREAFQLISGIGMVEDEPSMSKIESYFVKSGRIMTPNNRKQARVFAGATVLENKVGMAPGMRIDFQGKVWFFLPGVPKEMKQIASDEIMPFLHSLTGNEQIIKSRVLKFIGIGESTLEHELKDIISQQSNPTIAPLAQEEGVVIRLTAKGASDQQIEKLLDETHQRILERVGSHCYGIDDQTAEEAVVGMLKEKKLAIASAESLTGGLFSSKLISVDNASKVFPGGIVCYDAATKVNQLGVSSETIAKHGTVSEQCAEEMARMARSKFNSDIGISFTGVAGPGPFEDKPAGTVFISVSKEGHEWTEKHMFSGSRNTIRSRAVLKGLEMVYNLLKI